MSQRKKRNYSQGSETEESLWETLEDIETIFEKELKDLKEISSAGILHQNPEHNGNHFEEDESLIWNCGLCGSYYFKNHLHFNNHLLEHHSVDERKRKTQNVYGCLSCGNGFKDLQVLENHLLCEELCQKDYDKALLALYQSHSVPRFFAPLHLRCNICQERFDKLYRLLQNFPNCSHLEKNDWKRKSSDQSVAFPQPRSRENGSHHQHTSKDTTGIKDKKTSKASLKTLTKVLDSLQDEINLTSPMDCAEDPLYFNNHFFRSNTSIKDSIHDNSQICEEEEQDDGELDSLISMSSIKSKMIKLNSRKKSKVAGVAESSNSVCHGFNGAKWIHSKPLNRIKNSKKASKNKNKFNSVLNLDGTFDEDLDVRSSIEVIDIGDDEEEGILKCTSKPASFSQPCLDCKILNFESRSSFIFHQIFLHDKSYCSHCDLIFETFTLLQNHNKQVHHTFSCDRCKKVFSNRFDLSSHSREFHDEFPCSFCHLILTKDSIEDHYNRSHRLKMPSTTYENPNELRIISEISSETATCSFCRRKKPLRKVFSHLQNWHHFSSPLLLELLVTSGFTFDLQANSSSIADVKPLSLTLNGLQNTLGEEVYSLKFDDKCLSHKFPKNTYTCPIEDCESKERIDQDYGLHLIIHHNLKYCYPCDYFMKSDYQVESHNSNFHSNAFKCSQCKTHFDDIFSLFDHRIQSHGLITCCLCNNAIFMHKKPFSDHLYEFHGVDKSWCERFDMFQIYRQSLVTVCTSLSKMKCNLCQGDEFELSNCGSLRLHLSSKHNFGAFDLFFASYDGQKGFNLSSILPGEIDGPSKEDQSVCITDKDVNVILEGHQSDHEDTIVYICKLCNRNFESSSELQSHVDEFHQKKDSQTFRCDFCPIATSSLIGMKNHLLKVHKSSILVSEKYSYKCAHCKKTFWSLGERRAHMNEKHKNHQGGNDFKCKICMHISPDRSALRRHFQRMHPNDYLRSNVSYECEICQINFQWNSQLRHHVKEVHKTTEENNCNACGITFKSTKSLKNHYKLCLKKKRNQKEYTSHEANNEIREFHEEKKSIDQSIVSKIEKESSYVETNELLGGRPTVSTSKIRKAKCEFCGVILATAKVREEHYKNVHNGLLPFTCNECYKGFSTKSSLVNHKNTHGSFKCSFCSKEFFRKDSFNEHQLIHTGPRYICPRCPKEFVQKSNLRRHIRIHLGIKPYKCKHCQKAFSDSAATKAHESIHQRIKLTCEVCGQTFARQQKLNYHMRIHTGNGLLICDVCQKVFTNSYSMKRHLLTHSDSKKFTCSLCSETFKSRKKLAVHLKQKENIGKTCKECGLEFHSETELNAHVLGFHRESQKELKGYKCRHCESSFNSLSDIREHLLLKHGIKQDLPFHFINGFRNEQEDQLYKEPTFMVEQPQELNCVQCMLCGGITKDLMNFESHLKAMHNVSCSKENGSFKCPICNLEVGSDPIKLNMHIITNHEDSVSPIVHNQNNEEKEENEKSYHLKEIIPADVLGPSIDDSEIKIDPEYLESK